jgi:RNA polymerase sigma-70 factor (ECF subfamily)
MPAQERPDAGLTDRDHEVAQRFVAAWNRCDIAALAALLREDAILRMPPERVQIEGAQAVTAFFATVPASGKLDLFQLRILGANGSPAIAAYLPDDTGTLAAYGLMALTIEDGQMSAITGFPDPNLFSTFGLSDHLTDAVPPRPFN